MRKAVAVLAFLGLLVSTAPPLRASTPVINANTYGLEFCPQYICGAAVFAGVLGGQVGSNPFALGTFVVAVTHEDLPPPFQTAGVTGGFFQLNVGSRQMQGVILGGTLLNNGNNTFTVNATMLIVSGGSGIVRYQGLLNHNTFPPTIVGPLFQ